MESGSGERMIKMLYERCYNCMGWEEATRCSGEFLIKRVNHEYKYKRRLLDPDEGWFMMGVCKVVMAV